MLSQEKAFDDRDEWRLLADALSLLAGITDVGRLGFALQLKFRQVQGYYPDSVHDFPSGIMHIIAEQIGCASVSPENYPFQGRQAQRHRQNIRRYLGVRLSSKADTTGSIGYQGSLPGAGWRRSDQPGEENHHAGDLGYR